MSRKMRVNMMMVRMEIERRRRHIPSVLFFQVWYLAIVEFFFSLSTFAKWSSGSKLEIIWSFNFVTPLTGLVSSLIGQLCDLIFCFRFQNLIQSLDLCDFNEFNSILALYWKKRCHLFGRRWCVVTCCIPLLSDILDVQLIPDTLTAPHLTTVSPLDSELISIQHVWSWWSDMCCFPPYKRRKAELSIDFNCLATLGTFVFQSFV